MQSYVRKDKHDNLILIDTDFHIYNGGQYDVFGSGYLYLPKYSYYSCATFTLEQSLKRASISCVDQDIMTRKHISVEDISDDIYFFNCPFTKSPDEIDFTPILHAFIE